MVAVDATYLDIIFPIACKHNERWLIARLLERSKSFDVFYLLSAVNETSGVSRGNYYAVMMELGMIETNDIVSTNEECLYLMLELDYQVQDVGKIIKSTFNDQLDTEDAVTLSLVSTVRLLLEYGQALHKLQPFHASTKKFSHESLTQFCY